MVLSLNQRLLSAESTLSHSCIDLSIVLKARETGEYSDVYGGRYDLTIGRYTGPAQMTHVLEVSVAQLQWIRCEVRNQLAWGGRGAGKSHALVRWALTRLLEFCGHRLMLMSPTYRKARVLWRKMLRQLPTMAFLLPGKAGVRRSEMELHFANGSVCAFISADNPDSPRSEDNDDVGTDERQGIPQEAQNNLVLTCRRRQDYQARQIGTATMAGDFFAEYTRFERLENAATFSFSSYTNPFIPHAVFEDAKATMDARTYRREVLAEWVSGEGLVYWSFDQSLHVRSYYSRERAAVHVQKMFTSAEAGVGDDITHVAITSRYRTIRHHVSYVVGMDFNLSPMCALIYKILRTPGHAQDLMWAVDEIVIDDAAHATRMGLMLRNLGYTPDKCIIIPDASGAGIAEGGATAKSNHRLLRDLGYTVICMRHNPRVVDRINAVATKLLNARNETTLLFDPKCTRTIDAMRSQGYDQRGKPDKGTGYDHYCDAMGYPVAFLYPAGLAPRVSAPWHNAFEQRRSQDEAIAATAAASGGVGAA